MYSHTFLCQCAGYRIKRGWNVNVDAKSVHFDPIVHDNPFEFNPSRFDVILYVSTSFLVIRDAEERGYDP